MIKELNYLVKDLLKENKLIKNELKIIKDGLKNKNKELEIITNYYKSLTNENNQIKNRLKIIEDYLKQKENISEKKKSIF